MHNNAKGRGPDWKTRGAKGEGHKILPDGRHGPWHPGQLPFAGHRIGLARLRYFNFHRVIDRSNNDVRSFI